MRLSLSFRLSDADSLPFRKLPRKSGALASLATFAPTMGLLMMGFLALSFLIFPGKGRELSSLPSGKSSSAEYRTSSDLSSSSRYSSADFTGLTESFSMVASVVTTFCDPSIQYRDLPAECQTAENSRRLTLYVVRVGWLLLGLMASLLAFTLVRG